MGLLINAMFLHGYTPNKLLESALISIPKDTRGNLCSLENYRGIALCSALCKLIDNIIIDKYGDTLFTSELQFAFKEGHSTSMCTTVLKEVASYYKSKNTDVYVCMLDASKAFDRVHYGKLFNLLRARKLPAMVIRLLLDMYTRQRMCTSWNGTNSDFFTTQNGVKQGAILSPILFCVYIDELLNRINDSGIGCHVGHTSYAGLGYADDVNMLVPSTRGLQKLLYICEEFANEYNVQFNASKTVCMRIGSNGRTPIRTVTLNGTPVKWKRIIKHLGNIITCDLNDNDDIIFKKGNFISQVNKLNNKFTLVSSLVKANLLQTYCCSWYGCQTWDIESKHVAKMGTEWNKAVRRTLNLPRTTHRNLLPLIVRGRSFIDQLISRTSKFIHAFTGSSNLHIQYIAARARFSTSGALGRNWVRCVSSGYLTPDGCLQLNTDSSHCVNVHQDDSLLLAATAASIRDFLDIRDGVNCIDGFRWEDAVTMLETMCVM